MEPKQHKVTVTGDVDADTLVKKLIKEGKHAELWPEQEESKQGEAKKKKKKKKNKKKKENEPKSSEEDGTSEGTEKDEEEEAEQSVKVKVNGGKPESKHSVKVTEISQTGNQSSFRVELKGGGGDAPAEKAGAGGGKSSKKKKNKGHKGNPAPDKVDVSVVPAPGITGFAPLPGQINLNPQMQQFYPYPAYEPPSYAPPMYAMSYNTSYPSVHHTALYQMGPVPPHANAYMHMDELYTPSQPLDVIDDVYAEEEEDEDGSAGCSIM